MNKAALELLNQLLKDHNVKVEGSLSAPCEVCIIRQPCLSAGAGKIRASRRFAHKCLDILGNGSSFTRINNTVNTEDAFGIISSALAIIESHS